MYYSENFYFWCQVGRQINNLALGQPSAQTAWGALVFLVDLIVVGEEERFHGFRLNMVNIQ